MSDSEVNTTLMETTRLYKDDLELSPMKFFRTSQDMINNPSEAARLIRVLILYNKYNFNFILKQCQRTIYSVSSKTQDEIHKFE